MGRGSLGEAIDSGIGWILAFFGLVIAVIIAVSVYPVESAAEGATWDAGGQAIGVAAGGLAQAAWSALGIALDAIAFIGLIALIVVLLLAFSRRGS